MYPRSDKVEHELHLKFSEEKAPQRRRRKLIIPDDFDSDSDDNKVLSSKLHIPKPVNAKFLTIRRRLIDEHDNDEIIAATTYVHDSLPTDGDNQDVPAVVNPDYVANIDATVTTTPDVIVTTDADATSADPQPLELSDSNLPPTPRVRYIEVSFERMDNIIKEMEMEKLSASPQLKSYDAAVFLRRTKRRHGLDTQEPGS